jgi:hypothetical protein
MKRNQSPFPPNQLQALLPESLLKDVSVSARNDDGRALVVEATYIPFVGGEDTNRQPALVPLGGFSRVMNMRPVRPGMRKRKGQRVLHTVADGGTPKNTAQNIFSFSKGKQSENNLICQWSDGGIDLATAAAPTVTTGAFGTALFAAGTTGLLPGSCGVFEDLFFTANGTGAPLVWPGVTAPVSKFIKLQGLGVHSMIPEIGEDYTFQVTDGLADTEADLDGLGDYSTDYDAWYIKTETIPNAFNYTINHANDEASVLALEYCKGDGVWSTATITNDGTSGAVGEPTPGEETGIFELDFETGACPAGWTETTRSADSDLDFDAAPLATSGTYSLKVLDTVGNGYSWSYLTSPAFTADDHVKLSFDIKINELPAATGWANGYHWDIIELKDTSANSKHCFWLQIFNGGDAAPTVYKFRLRHYRTGQTLVDTYSSAITVGTQYHLDFEWSNPSDGTGIMTWDMDTVNQLTDTVNATIYDGSYRFKVDTLVVGIGIMQSYMFNTGPSSYTIDNIDLNTVSAALQAVGTLTKTGKVAITAPADIVPTYMFGDVGYWWRFSIADDGELGTNTKIQAVTYEGAMHRMQSFFNGVPVSSPEAILFIYSGSLYYAYSPVGMPIGDMTSSDSIYFCSLFPIEAIYLDPGATPNEGAATAINHIRYHNGADFVETSTGNLVDGTAGLANAGWVTFGRQPDAKPVLFRNSAIPMYWYQIQFDDTLSTDVTLMDIETIPYFDISEFGNCVCMEAWKTRMVYAFERDPGYVMICPQGNPQCLNGSDFAIQEIGDGRANKVTCMKKFYNELLVWQEEKGKDGGCLTLIEGYSPTTYGILLVSAQYGTFSAKSAVVIENMPYSEAIAKSEKGESVTVTAMRTLAAFISRSGILATDGKTVFNIGSDKIQKFFDPNETGYCIRRGYEKEHWMGYDTQYQVLRVGLVTGASATVPNTFLVYDVVRKEWSEDTLAQALTCMVEVEASSGNAPVVQVGGGTADGFVYQLNYGQDDVSTAIDSYCIMELNFMTFQLWLEEIILRMKVQSAGSCTVTPYVNGVAGTARTLLMTAEASSETLRRHRIGFPELQGNSLSLKFQNATAAEDMELLDVGMTLYRDVSR